MKSLLTMAKFFGPYRWQAVLAVVLLMGVVASDLLIPWLTQRIVDQGIS